MKNIKKQLNNNDGFALAGAIVLIAVLTLFGVSMYAYSMQSLNTIKWGTDRQKAEYLARAGVEASVYRYQDAVQKSYSNTDVEGFITSGLVDGSEIMSSKVYLLKDGKTYTEAEPANTDDYIGYFEVKITNEEKAVYVYSLKKSVKIRVKVFSSTGHVNGKAATREGYITPASDGYNSGWYDNNGAIVTNLPESDTIRRTVNGVNGEYNFNIQILSTKFTIMSKRFSEDIHNFIGYGNLVLSAPTNENGNGVPIHFANNENGFASFMSLNNLFVNADIETNPSGGNFQAIALIGNEIVVNGDINMYAYYCSSSLASSLFNTLAQNMYLGTVIINSPSSSTSTVTDPANNGCGDCGKIYFNGNVYINIYVPNEGMKKYKLFSSGDIYYFDNSFMKTDDGAESAVGIDLMKYFLDTSIEEGRFDSSTIQRFETIRKIYYESTGYFTNAYSNYSDVPAMRKIDIEKNRVDTIQDTIPPVAIDSSSIIWDK